MENTPLKFRQPVFINRKFDRWHYWGFISDKDEFAGITTPIHIAKKSQQFSGQKDNEGQEIYLGDLVQETYIINGEEIKFRIQEVCWIEEDCCFGLKPSMPQGYQRLHYNEHRKIIGNTTENPELCGVIEND